MCYDFGMSVNPSENRFAHIERVLHEIAELSHEELKELARSLAGDSKSEHVIHVLTEHVDARK